MLNMNFAPVKELVNRFYFVIATYNGDLVQICQAAVKAEYLYGRENKRLNEDQPGEYVAVQSITNIHNRDKIEFSELESINGVFETWAQVEEFKQHQLQQ